MAACIDDSDDESNLHDNSESADSNAQYLLFRLNIRRFKELNRCQLFPAKFGPIFTVDFTEQANKFIVHFSEFLEYFGLFTDYIPTCSSALRLSVFHSLSTCPLLEKLTIHVNSSPPQDITSLAYGLDLCKHKTLQKLDIFNIQFNGIKALGESSSVRELSCNVEFTSDDTVEEFCDMLQQNITLEEIELEVCRWDDIMHNYWLQTIGRGILDEVMPAVSSRFLQRRYSVQSDAKEICDCNEVYGY